MNPTEFHTRILVPGLARLADLGGPRVTTEAARLLLAIALQETGLAVRCQVLNDGGPGRGRGWWQFESGGGVRGVMRHPRTADLARAVCRAEVVGWESAAIWRALEGHDGLAVAFARLLVLSDPRALPRTAEDGWDYYQRNWRPGKPHPATWAGHWATATDVVIGAAVDAAEEAG